jgi:hypothetical protein
MAPVGQASRQARQRPQCGVAGAVHRQRQVDIEFAEKEPGARLAVDQVGVFADPAQAGLLRQGFLHHRGRVDEDAVAIGTDQRPDALASALQALAQQLVIIPAEGIAGDEGRGRAPPAAPRSGLDRCGLGQVVHPRTTDHTQGAGNQFRGPGCAACHAGPCTSISP